MFRLIHCKLILAFHSSPFNFFPLTAYRTFDENQHLTLPKDEEKEELSKNDCQPCSCIRKGKRKSTTCPSLVIHFAVSVAFVLSTYFTSHRSVPIFRASYEHFDFPREHNWQEGGKNVAPAKATPKLQTNKNKSIYFSLNPISACISWHYLFLEDSSSGKSYEQTKPIQSNPKRIDSCGAHVVNAWQSLKCRYYYYYYWRILYDIRLFDERNCKITIHIILFI